MVSLTLKGPEGEKELTPNADDIARWKAAYPGLNIDVELQKISVWLDANPAKRWTPRGWKAGVNRWLSNEQDKQANRSARNSQYNQQPERKQRGDQIENYGEFKDTWKLGEIMLRRELGIAPTAHEQKALDTLSTPYPDLKDLVRGIVEHCRQFTDDQRRLLSMARGEYYVAIRNRWGNSSP